MCVKSNQIKPYTFKKLLSIVWQVSNHDGYGLEDGCLLKVDNFNTTILESAVESEFG